MNAKLGLIFSRRSIRKYTEMPVSSEEIRSLLEAAMAAPSANNSQPWRFVLVRDKEKLRRLAEAHPHGKMLAKAALAIAVCGDPAISDWWVVDCAAATENILLAAAGLGLGGVWLGCHGRKEREEEVRRELHIPATIGVLSLVALGHPGEHKEPRTQYDPAKVRSERW
jgi:nitroreductase